MSNKIENDNDFICSSNYSNLKELYKDGKVIDSPDFTDDDINNYQKKLKAKESVEAQKLLLKEVKRLEYKLGVQKLKPSFKRVVLGDVNSDPEVRKIYFDKWIKDISRMFKVNDTLNLNLNAGDFANFDEFVNFLKKYDFKNDRLKGQSIFSLASKALERAPFKLTLLEKIKVYSIIIKCKTREVINAGKKRFFKKRKNKSI